MRAYFARRWFLLLLCLFLGVGLAWPAQLKPLADAVPQNYVVAIVLFLMAFPLEAGIMWGAIRRPTAVLLGVGINAVVLPLLAWGVSFALPRDLGIGLLIAGSVPCTLASATAWTRRAGGNDAVAMMVTMVTNLACFVVMPMWLMLTTGTRVQIADPLGMMQRLSLLVVAPTVFAQLLRLIPPLGRWASSRKLPLGVLAQMGILSIVFVGAVRSGTFLRDSASGAIGPFQWLLMLAAVLGTHLAMLWLGYSIGKPLGLSRADRIAVGLSGSQKTLMIGIDMATTYFAAIPLAMLPMVAFHVSQLMVDTLIADRWRETGLAEARATPLPPAP